MNDSITTTEGGATVETTREVLGTITVTIEDQIMTPADLVQVIEFLQRKLRDLRGY